MVLPALYREGLAQRSLAGEAVLNAYKLGLVEAILKDGLRGERAGDLAALDEAARTALEVVRWEPGRGSSE